MSQLLTADDVAKRLNVSLRHAYFLIKTQQIVPVKVGVKSIRVEPQELERFITSRKGDLNATN